MRSLAVEADVKERFTNDTANHQMTVLHDDGLYRHVRFKAPDTGMYYYDLITWPGHLTISGDMGTWTFARSRDMFEFFRANRPDRINADYWAEKLQHGASGGRDSAKEYDEGIYRQVVKDEVESYVEDLTPGAAAALRADVQERLLDDQGWDYPGVAYEPARDAIANYRFEWDGATAQPPVAPAPDDDEDAEPEDDVDFRFEDSWEWDLRGYSYHYLWACYAIQAGIHRYDAAKHAEAVSA